VGLPVPAVFLYVERRSQIFFVVDGQQRLKSIFYFFEGYFGPETQGARRVFRLTGLSPDSVFNNKTYNDLRDEDQRKLRNAVIRAFIVQQLDPADDTSMYHIFERLNTGGTLLTNQEIRNCVYHGAFIDFLHELNDYPKWRDILGTKVPDTRKKDLELLVRFFAMRDISGYRKPMKDFLSRYMKKNRDASEAALKAARDVFEHTCDVIVSSFGERPFHVRAGLNAAVFDAVMTAFSKHADSVPSDVSRRYQQLKATGSFQDATRSSTTDVDTVKERLRVAEETLFG
jgi:uncharacterized protein with ParB-like and HNH nuclease domain